MSRGRYAVNTSVCLSVTAGDVYTDAYSAAWHDTGRRVQPGSGGDREGYWGGRWHCGGSEAWSDTVGPRTQPTTAPGPSHSPLITLSQRANRQWRTANKYITSLPSRCLKGRSHIHMCARMSKITKNSLTQYSMLCSCTYMATVGVNKTLNHFNSQLWSLTSKLSQKNFQRTLLRLLCCCLYRPNTIKVHDWLTRKRNKYHITCLTLHYDAVSVKICRRSFSYNIS